MIHELVINSFDGGGSASEDIPAAIGWDPDYALNHKYEALAMYRINHPRDWKKPVIYANVAADDKFGAVAPLLMDRGRNDLVFFHTFLECVRYVSSNSVSFFLACIFNFQAKTWSVGIWNFYTNLQSDFVAIIRRISDFLYDDVGNFLPSFCLSEHRFIPQSSAAKRHKFYLRNNIYQFFRRNIYNRTILSLGRDTTARQAASFCFAELIFVALFVDIRVISSAVRTCPVCGETA